MPSLLKVALAVVSFSIAAFASPNSFTIDQVLAAPFASGLLAAPHSPRVAWILNESGRRNIYIAGAPDWKARKVTAFNDDDGQEIDELAWAPDASYLVFARGGDFENGEDNPNPALSSTRPDQSIWIARLDGSAKGADVRRQATKELASAPGGAPDTATVLREFSPAKKITEGRAPAVSPKGDLIAFVRGGQIYTMPPNGENPVEAVAQKWPMENLRWSPDGSQLAFLSNRKDHGFIGVYTPATKTLRYLDASVDRDISPVWSRDGMHLAYVRIPARPREAAFGPHREGEPWTIRIADIATGTGHEIFRAKPGPGSVFHAIVSNDQIFWTSSDRIVLPWEQTGWCHLYSVPVTGGEAIELTPGEGEVEHVSINPAASELARLTPGAPDDIDTVFYSANFGDIDRRHLWTVNASGHAPPRPLTTGENIEWSPAPLADDSGVALLASSYNQASHAALRLSSGEIKPLAPETIPADFPAASLVKPQPVRITAADGLEIHGQLFLPRGDTGHRHPALIFFHGGSRREMLLGFHYMYYYSNAYSLNQYLANHGYIVLSVNYRSGIGYGLDFREAINYGATGASEFNDVIGAGLFLKSRPDVDPQRIGVWGGSYGGYLTALALARASDLFAAGVDFHGVHDWSTLETATGPPSDPTVALNTARLAFNSSPMASVDTWRSPVLLIHGDDDRNVAFSQTVALVEALRKQHVDFEELILPNEIHDFLMHRHWVEAYKADADFFARKLHVGQGSGQ